MKLMKRNSAHYPTFSNMLDRLFDDDFFIRPNGFKMANGFLPATNVKETDSEYLMEIAAPGRKKEDFKIEIENDTLNISSEVKVNKETEKEGFTRREFRYSNFTRSFVLPEGVDSEAIKANYTDGILSLSIPKVEVEEVDSKRVIEIA